MSATGGLCATNPTGMILPVGAVWSWLTAQGHGRTEAWLGAEETWTLWKYVFSEHNSFMSEKTLEMAKAIAYDPKWIIASQSEHTRLEEKTVQWACAQIKKPNVFLEYGPMTFMPDDLKNPLETSVVAIMNAMKWANALEGKVTVPKFWRRTPYYTCQSKTQWGHARTAVHEAG